METFAHPYHLVCGSPELDQAGQTITAALVSPDAPAVRLTVKSLVRGHVHGLHLPGVPDRTGQPLLRDVPSLTLNLIPGSLSSGPESSGHPESAFTAWHPPERPRKRRPELCTLDTPGPNL